MLIHFGGFFIYIKNNEMKLNKIFEAILREKNQLNKIVQLNKDTVDIIRKNNYKLDTILSNKIFTNPNIFIKGGVARIAFQNYLGDYSDLSVRDIDYCYLGDYKEYITIFRDIEKLIGDRLYYEHNINYYFNNRDITFNEVLLRPDGLWVTRRAIRDYNNQVINPKAKYVSSRIYSRLLLFAVRYGFKVPEDVVLDDDLNTFQFLLCLLKSYEIGIEQKYYKICKDHRIADENNVSEWLVYLLNNQYFFDLNGREKYLATKLIDADVSEEELIYLYKKYPKLKIEVDEINFNDQDYLMFFSKRNRNEKINKRLGIK
jgi:hypothetical protein